MHNEYKTYPQNMTPIEITKLVIKDIFCFNIIGNTTKKISDGTIAIAIEWVKLITLLIFLVSIYSQQSAIIEVNGNEATNAANHDTRLPNSATITIISADINSFIK
ncbi:hypothetical protein DID75_01445 [Candidatus Marinamargulisbacteria bacterium SCGC AG-410-N11]|nr:hypothetical protein DID75_01445 [Candidatus Marinamargulisbacteria bacterium SCGC AG-410-N11]